MPKPRTKPEDIRNPEHYFNRFIALEIKRDQAAQKYIEDHEASMDEKMERDCFHLNISVNTRDDMLLRAIISKEPEGWLDLLENERISAVIRRLPPRQREIIRLYYLEGWSFVEIAHHMGISKQAVSKNHARAITFLKEILGSG